ncbi:MAG: arginine--tRNA ligase [Thermoguttaceae bacterium]|jgi:arginyl-tRNA synthetase|nr:arginine--tRNA ligase [Thermoguttaceae bacterium]
MSLLAELRARFHRALAPWVDDPAAAADLLALVRRSQDPRFGDYQANLAMPLGKRLGRPPREVAAEIVARLDVDDLCHAPEIAGPGFINLRLRDEALARRLEAAASDPRLGVATTPSPRTYVVDYSAPNVAKPMHVGHIRSTVIGDSLCRMLRFVGHRVIGDNHLGDWGTQFGMILYGWKRGLVDRAAYQQDPVRELARVYQLVHAIATRWAQRRELPEHEATLTRLRREEQRLAALAPKGPKEAKQRDKDLAKVRAAIAETESHILAVRAAWDDGSTGDPLAAMARLHEDADLEVLRETARLHDGDPENRAIWREILPPCREAIEAIYRRLGVTFDCTLGESFYHDQLAGLVDELLARGIARESDGAICIFLDGHDVPMIVRKQDGAFLYATTDLATVRYRMETWRPDAILYVVDHRQSLHFEHLFAAARRMGYADVELAHVSFGTVLGKDGRPFKTRAGDTVGLEGLLDEAVRRARQIVSANDDAKPEGPELSPQDRDRIAEVVGIGALKYADLSQNRTSDYEFDYDKMLAMNGNTATYMQYAYARVRSIFRKQQIDIDALCAGRTPIVLATPAERALGLDLLRFGEAIDLALADYRPNLLTSYLFDLANRYSTFYEQCPVLKAESEALRASRLLLCDLTARTIRQGLDLLGIAVVEKM